MDTVLIITITGFMLIILAAFFVLRGIVTNRRIIVPVQTTRDLHQLPPPPSDFTGRTVELAQLLTAYEKDSITVFGLWGMGGVGKTALALKFAQQLAPYYPDAHFYLDLRGTSPQPLSVTDAMAHIIRAYHLAIDLPKNEDELGGLYRSILHGERVIILVDNATGVEQIIPLIPPSNCMLLITSRQHFTLPGLCAKHLGPLPPDDARALLLKIAPRVGDQVDAIARLFGYLPLALRLVGHALLEQADINPTDYVQRLEKAEARLKLIDASLRPSYEILSVEMQKLWCKLAVFPEGFDKFAAAAVWALDIDSAHDALSELVVHSLVEWYEFPSPSLRRAGDLETFSGVYRLHDLARLFAAAYSRDTNPIHTISSSYSVLR